MSLKLLTSSTRNVIVSDILKYVSRGSIKSNSVQELELMNFDLHEPFISSTLLFFRIQCMFSVHKKVKQSNDVM